eukprot:gene2825-4232_t
MSEEEEEDEFDRIVNQFGPCKEAYMSMDACLDENNHSWVRFFLKINI